MNASSVLSIARRSARETYVLCFTSCAGGAFFGGAVLGPFGLRSSTAEVVTAPATTSAIPRRKRRRRSLGDEGTTRIQREYQEEKSLLGRR